MVRRGLSLVEILAVIAIISVIASLLLPAVARSRTRSFVATDISNLRQIGFAGHLYQEQFEAMVLRTKELVESGLLSSQLCRSPYDTTTRGTANGFVLKANQPKTAALPHLTDYKNSYVGFGDFGFTEDSYRKAVQPFSDPGWLVALGESRSRSPYDLMMEGNYLRLLSDGSVRRKHHREIVGRKNGRRSFGATVYMLFSDAPDEWLRQVIFGE